MLSKDVPLQRKEQKQLQDYLHQLDSEEEAYVNEHPSIKLISHPHRVLIIGKSQSGKTTFGVKLILHRFRHVIQDLYIMSSTIDLQATYKPLWPWIKPGQLWVEATEKNFYQLVMLLEKNRFKRRSLLLIDDQSAEQAINKGGKGIFAWIVYNSVWLNLSIMTIAHRVSSVSSSMRENSEHVILFQMPNRNQKSIIEKEFNIIGTPKDFMALLKKETDMIPHGAVHISLATPVTVHPNFRITEKEDAV